MCKGRACASAAPQQRTSPRSCEPQHPYSEHKVPGESRLGAAPHVRQLVLDQWCACCVTSGCSTVSAAPGLGPTVCVLHVPFVLSTACTHTHTHTACPVRLQQRAGCLAPRAYNLCVPARTSMHTCARFSLRCWATRRIMGSYCLFFLYMLMAWSTSSPCVHAHTNARSCKHAQRPPHRKFNPCMSRAACEPCAGGHRLDALWDSTQA